MTKYYHNLQPSSRVFSVLSPFSKIFVSVFLLAELLFISSCEENPAIIGSGLLPSSDFVTIRSTDKLSVNFFTQYVDSVISNGDAYSYLGRLSDPVFGATKTDFVSQLRLTQKWPGGGAFAIDSVKLYFYILGAKGTLGADIIHKINISEIGEMLNSTTSYYSNRAPDTIKDLGTYDLPVITKDTTQYLTVELPVSLGQYLMRDTLHLTQDIDSLDFRTFFKGIYVTMVDSPDPFLMALQFESGDFVLEVYYHNAKATGLTFDFVISKNSIRYNRYFHDFSTAPPETRIKHLNDGIRDSLTYLQGFNGVFPRIKIPELTAFKDSMPISVNKAKMIVTVYLDSTDFKTANIPKQIYLSYKSADSTKFLVSDYLVSSSFFDGKFNTSTKTFTFNIASFAQQYVEGKIPSPILEMYYPSGEYRNVILKTNNNKSPVKFEFTYTKY